MILIFKIYILLFLCKQAIAYEYRFYSLQ